MDDLSASTYAAAREFDRAVESAVGSSLIGDTVGTIQVNIGLRCNLACRHCHVASSPARTEEMAWETMVYVLRAARMAAARTLDVTGGAPEMHPCFREFVRAARAQALEVTVRTNLTILMKAGHEDLPEFFAANGVQLVASLPCYLEVNVDRQRGRHVYAESIEAIRRLNHLGYGAGTGLSLDLVFNPGGASLPPAQAPLEQLYKRELARAFGLRFDRLYTITNMPIGRFQDDLRRRGEADAYLTRLRDAFNPATVAGLMCRHQLHVGWDGSLYDCDFNFALGLPIASAAGHVRDFDPAVHARRRVRTGAHCFGCTAGAGSSCKGAIEDRDS